MSDRPHHRGGGRGGSGSRGGGGHRGGGGGRGGSGAGGAAGGDKERPKKENILDLGKYMDKRITVKFNGGREGTMRRSPPTPFSPFVVTCQNASACTARWGLTFRQFAVQGTLKGYDALMNLVLDDGKETVRGQFIRSLENQTYPILSPTNGGSGGSLVMKEPSRAETLYSYYR
jgi:small nuclear ribonucleoprotein (snRNP)-like protein